MRAGVEKFNAFLIAQVSGRSVLMWFGAVIFWFAVFGVVLVPAFEAASSGLRPVDLAFPTTPELIFSQLPSYTDATLRAYGWFAAVDFLYPPTLAMFFASLWAWLFVRTPNSFFVALQSRGILLLPFAAALFDWLENIGFLIVIFSYPPELRGVAEAACAFKTAKLAVHGADIGLTLIFALVAWIHAMRARRGFS